MGRYLKNIVNRMTGMSKTQKLEYIATYYWYHILGLLGALALLVFLIVHFGFGEKEPYFSMVLINQPVDYERDAAMENAFLAWLGEYDGGPVDISSDYNFSYGEIKLEGVNESSYEKFFFRLGGRELDAVIMPESFYRHCLEMDVEFTDLSEMQTGNLSLYEEEKEQAKDLSAHEEGEAQGKNLPLSEENGKKTAVYVGETGLAGQFEYKAGEELLLAFPASGRNREACQEFLDFVRDLTQTDKIR